MKKSVGKNISAIVIIAILFSMVIATFIEKTYGQLIAAKYIYNAIWFDFFWLLLAFFTMISVLKKENKKRISSLLLHISCVMIIIGFSITKNFGHSGFLQIQKNEKTNQYLLIDKKTNYTLERKFPFEIALNDYQIDYYPGSKQVSSYSVDISLRQGRGAIAKTYSIEINKPLKYKSYRLYLTSIDDETATVSLMVAYDKWGIVILYLGFALLVLSILLLILDKKSRLRVLLTKYKTSVFIVLLPMFLSGFAVDLRADSNAEQLKVGEENAKIFGKLWVQDGSSRIKPINTLASELCLKLYGKKQYKKMKSEEVILSMMSKPQLWVNEPIIKIKNKHIAKKIGVSTKYASFADFFDGDFQYKLSDDIKNLNINNKNNSKLEKDIIAIDEKINIYIMIREYDFIKVFPHPNNPEDSWLYPKSKFNDMEKIDSAFVRDAILVCCQYLNIDKNKDAEYILNGISKYQKKYAAEILPSVRKLKAEIIYNTIDIFPKLFKLYLIIGFVLLFMTINNIINSKQKFNNIYIILKILVFVSFATQTMFFILRAYISGHLPISNGYEVMLFISWFSILLFILYRKSDIVAATSIIFSGLCLLVANLNWMNPEITNLVPVLKSTWLSIHVSTIISSYTFAGVTALISCIYLSVYIINKNRQNEAINNQNKKLNIINEILLWFALFLMIIGIITGAIWANEAWGSYWSWDPKETWALITMVCYTALLHKYKNMNSIHKHIFTALVFITILITYFGVNYYFGGIHAYGG